MGARSNAYTVMAVLAVTLALTTACHNTDDVTAPPSGGGASSLTSSGSSPADGDGTLTATATITVNNGGTGTDELDLSQTLGATGHEIVIVWDTSTHVVNSVQHIWGPAAGGATSGFTQCDPSGTPCDPAKVAVNFSGTTVTITNLTVSDAFGGSSASTLNGTIRW